MYNAISMDKLKRLLFLEDGSAYGVFSDNSFASLSANGDTFTYISPDGSQCFKQVTAFTCSQDYRHQKNDTQVLLGDKYLVDDPRSDLDKSKFLVREKIMELVKCVNTLAERPYLCESIIEDQTYFTTTSPLVCCSWKLDSEFRNILDDNSIQILSLQKNASVTLFPNGKLFQVCYPALIHTGSMNYHKMTRETISYPRKYWDIPLRIAMYFYNLHIHAISDESLTETFENNLTLSKNINYVVNFPETKPPFSSQCAQKKPNCYYENHELPSLLRIHVKLSSRNADPNLSLVNDNHLRFHCGLKMEVTSSCTFKYLLESNQVETVIHADMSCSLSLGNPPHSFKHWLYKPGVGPLEKLYDVGNIPHVKKHYDYQFTHECIKSYPLSQILNSSLSFLKYCEEIKVESDFSKKLNPSSSIYFPEEKPLTLSSIIQEEVALEKIGRFTLFKDGRIRALFFDRTILEMTGSGYCKMITRNAIVKEFYNQTVDDDDKYYVEYVILFKNWSEMSVSERGKRFETLDKLRDEVKKAQNLVKETGFNSNVRKIALKIHRFPEKLNLKNEENVPNADQQKNQEYQGDEKFFSIEDILRSSRNTLQRIRRLNTNMRVKIMKQ